MPVDGGIVQKFLKYFFKKALEEEIEADEEEKKTSTSVFLCPVGKSFFVLSSFGLILSFTKTGMSGYLKHDVLKHDVIKFEECKYMSHVFWF